MKERIARETRLRDLLAEQMRPLAMLVIVLVAGVPPLFFAAFRLGEVAETGQGLAAEVAGLLQREVLVQPDLWRYDTQKVTQQIDVLRQHWRAAAVLVVDARGPVLQVPAAMELPDSPNVFWVSRVAPGPLGAVVHVALPLRPLGRTTLAIALLFSMVGAALAFALWRVPLQAMDGAEARIRALLEQLLASKNELAALNASLERRVEDRSAQLRDALDSIRVQEQRVRELMTQSVRVQEAERRAIARDLHDSVGQTLTALRLQVQLLERKSQLGDHAQSLLDLVDVVLDETRRSVQRLAPPMLSELGLAEALRQKCADLQERSGLGLTWTVATLPPLDSALEAGCYRIAQEALANALRHGHAKALALSLTVSEEQLRLVVQDDGCGFDVQGAPQTRGLGGMRERAELLGGVLQVTSAPGEGTRVGLTLPIGGEIGAKSALVPKETKP